MIKEKNSNIHSGSPFRGTGGFLLHLADNTLMLAQRNSEWTGHGPVLEQDIAITNIALDLIGQSRNLYAHAATVYNAANEPAQKEWESHLPKIWKTYNRELQEDDLAMLREERQYLNLLITELPRGDWAFTTLRQFFFSTFQQLQYTALLSHEDETLRAIAEKSLKEVAYHIRWSAEWVIRLGDGTDESAARLNTALQNLLPYVGEFFLPAPYEAIDPGAFKTPWLQKVNTVFEQAQLKPLTTTQLEAKGISGGKAGKHTEHLGYLLTELQYMQRTYPNSVW